MQILNSAVITNVAGGMTVEKYDETTKELFKNVREKVQNNLEQLDQLASMIYGGYANFGYMPITDEL